MGRLTNVLDRSHTSTWFALLLVVWFGRAFLQAESMQAGMTPLLVMTVIATSVMSANSSVSPN